MALTKAPNVELLLSSFLRVQSELTALIEDNVYTELPGGFTNWPAVRVTRAGGAPPLQRLVVLDQPLMQIDVWGGPKVLTLEVAETVRALLAQRLPWTLAGKGTIQLDSLGGLRYLPDPTWDPARPRYTFDAVLVSRP